MSATVIDLATIKAGRAAAAAARKAKGDPLSNPRVVLIVRQIINQMIVDQERSKMRSANFSISNQEQ
jgi:hypothetical protein